jgi:hypothetical protein
MPDGHQPSPKGVSVQLLWGLQLKVVSFALSLLGNHTVSQYVQLNWYLE